MRQIANIGMRMWQFKYDADGFHFAKCTGGEDGTVDWELFSKLMDGENKNESKLRPRPFLLEQDPGGKKPPVHVSGFSFPNPAEGRKFMEKWFSEVAMRCPDNTPCFLFSRSTVDSPYLKAFTATSCVDYVFGTNCFREGYSYLYRDSDTMTVSLQINEDPLQSVMRRKWVRWTSQMQIMEFSPRFLLVQRDKKYGLYTLGIPSETMRGIQRSGLTWNRNHQLWFGSAEDVNIEPVLDIIRRDALPEPDILGYVPEWYCQMDKNKKTTGNGQVARGLLSLLFGGE